VWQRDPEIVVGEQAQPIKALEAANGGCCNPGFVDPKFTNPDKGDFSLQARSPALGTAALVALPTVPDFDLYGKPACHETAPDLGPIEVPISATQTSGLSYNRAQ